MSSFAFTFANLRTELRRVVSAGYTNMLELRRRDFATLLRTNPEMKQNIERVARAREAQNISAAAVSVE